MSKTEDNLNSRIDKIYPSHAKALQHAKIFDDNFPTTKSFLQDVATKKIKKSKEENENALKVSETLN